MLKPNLNTKESDINVSISIHIRKKKYCDTSNSKEQPESIISLKTQTLLTKGSCITEFGFSSFNLSLPSFQQSAFRIESIFDYMPQIPFL